MKMLLVRKRMIFVVLAVYVFAMCVFFSHKEFGTKYYHNRARGITPRKQKQVFCETMHLGCYTISVNKAHAFVANHTSITIHRCATLCKLNNTKLAAITAGNACMCGNDVNQLVEHRKPILSHACSTPCLGNSNETCGGKGVANLHLVKGDCVKEPFTQSYLKTRSKGCFNLPPSSLLRYDDVTSTSDCFLACELDRHPVALYRNPSSCYCGHMSDSFNLTHQTSDCNSSSSHELFRTLVEDKRCSESVFLPPGSRGRTLLASYPGSGNTWVRYMLERATGFYTGSVYGEKVLLNSGFLGENMNNLGRVDFIKEHFYFERTHTLSLLAVHAVVVLIRNPYKAFISLINLEKSNGKTHTAHAPEDVFRKEFTKKRKIEGMLKHWKFVPQAVIDDGKPFLVIYYEDLVENPISNIRKMVKFTKNSILPPPNLEERLACLSQDTTGMARREPKKILNPYSEELKEIINDGIREVRKILKDAGVRKELPPYEIDSEYL